MKKVLAVIAVLIIAAGLIVIPPIVAEHNAVPIPGGGGPGFSGRGGRGANTVFAVRVENVEIRTLQAYIEVNGNIISEQQVTVVPDIGGKLISMRVGLGSTVQKGALLAEVDPSRPGSVFALSPVYAPVSGIVVSNPMTAGSTVSAGAALFTIAMAGSIEIEALIPEREVGQLRTGLPADVRLEAFPGEIFAAELARLSPVVDPVSRTKKVTLRFTRDDRRINPGMFARIRLNTRTYRNVASIPQEALVEHRGLRVVYVLDESGESAPPNRDDAPVNGERSPPDRGGGRPPGGSGGGVSAGEVKAPGPAGTARVSMREVITGVSIDGEVEIKSGLAPGEAVVVQGQQFLTDGAPVRVIGRL